MSLSERGWWSDLAVSLAGYLFLFAVINKEAESILQPKSLEFFIHYLSLNHQLQTENVSGDYLVFVQKVFSAVIAPEICNIVILRYRKRRSPFMVQFDCNSSSANQWKVLSHERRTAQSSAFHYFILSMVWEVGRSQNEEKKPWLQWIVIISFTLPTPLATHHKGIALQILIVSLILQLLRLNSI